MKQLLTRRRFLFGAAVASTANAFFIEPNAITITEKEIHLPYLPQALNGLRVVHLTDFHYKPEKDAELIEKVLAEISLLSPDLILLTGDYVDGDNPDILPLIEHLKHLKAKHGIYACMGNHDGWVNPGSHYQKVFESIGIHFLINQNSQLIINGEKLSIAATDYIWRGKPDPIQTLKGIPKDSPLITLVHEPDYFDTMVKQRDNHLQLSGHTHGGQCRVPLLGYAPVKVKYGENYIYGSHEMQNSSLWVSRGIGTTGIRVRFACRPEIAVITLKST